jgi:hypothetical protein
LEEWVEKQKELALAVDLAAKAHLDGKLFAAGAWIPAKLRAKASTGQPTPIETPAKRGTPGVAASPAKRVARPTPPASYSAMDDLAPTPAEDSVNEEDTGAGVGTDRA